MTIEVKLKVDRHSARQVRERLKKLRKTISGKGGGNEILQVHRVIGNWLLRWIDDNFKSEGGKVGKWEPFKYGGRIVSKSKRGSGGKKLATSQSIVGGPGYRSYVDTGAKLLQDTGALKNLSWNSKATRTNVTVGSDLEYSFYHEKGLPMRNLPSRRMLPLDTDKDVTKALMNFYNVAIEKALKND